MRKARFLWILLVAATTAAGQSKSTNVRSLRQTLRFVGHEPFAEIPGSFPKNRKAETSYRPGGFGFGRSFRITSNGTLAP
jgi:hypothetical protein